MRFLSPLLGALLMTARPAAALDRLCDPAFENCRTPLLDLINNETQGIDVAFWFMEDSRYLTAIAARWRAGVPVRLLVDPRASATYPLNAGILEGFRTAGVPMRQRVASGILHWKMMLFVGQNTLELERQPVVNITWHDAVEYCNWLSQQDGLPAAYENKGGQFTLIVPAPLAVNECPLRRICALIFSVAPIAAVAVTSSARRRPVWCQ